MKKILLSLSLIVLLSVSVFGCTSKEEKATIDPSNEKNPIATITMEDKKEIVIELYPEVAPNTVANFIDLASSGYYDGLIFHRVIPDFMIQGGDPMGSGIGGPGYSIKGEFTSNGFQNNLSHTEGVISMARSNDPDSAGSQFFITVADSTFLDGNYASFGKVLSGLEDAKEISLVERDKRDKPDKEQKIKSITIDTKDVEYPKPEKIEE